MGLGSGSPIDDRSRMTLCGKGMGLGPESETEKKASTSKKVKADKTTEY